MQLVSRQEELDAPASAESNLMRFTIRPGTGAAEIASNLQKANLINDRDLFIDYARVEGYDRRFEAGVYFLNPTQSIKQIAEILTDSSRSFILFRTLEGARIEELPALIDANGLFGFSGDEFLALVSDSQAHAADFISWTGIPEGATLEGYIFPIPTSCHPISRLRRCAIRCCEPSANAWASRCGRRRWRKT